MYVEHSDEKLMDTESHSGHGSGDEHRNYILSFVLTFFGVGAPIRTISPSSKWVRGFMDLKILTAQLEAQSGAAVMKKQSSCKTYKPTENRLEAMCCTARSSNSSSIGRIIADEMIEC